MSSIERSKLLAALNLARPALASQPYVPAFTHFLFNEDGITAYNDLAGIEINFDAGLDGCLPGDLVLKSLSSMAGSSVSLAPVEGESAIQIACGRAKIKAPKLPVEDFPIKWPNISKAEKLPIDDAILAGIKNCLVGVGTNPTHPAQMGVTLDTIDGKAVLYSTDNVTMSRHATKIKVDLPGESPVIMPTFFCEQLLSLSRAFSDEQVTIHIQPGVLVATIGKQARLMAKTLVDLQPIDFPGIIAKTIKSMGDASSLPIGWDEAMQRALFVLDTEKDKAAKVTSKRGVLRIVANSGHSESDDELDFSGEGPDEPAYIDPSLVVRGSKAATRLAFCNGALMLGSDDGSYVHLIAYSQKR